MLGFFLAAALSAAEPPPVPCDVECERLAAGTLLDQGETRAAVEHLKGARRRFPDDSQLVLQLARAYLLENNLFWAERTLQEALTRWPDDPEIRSWLAAVHLRQGDPELVIADLDAKYTPTDDPQRARWRLLTVSQARLAGNDAEADSMLSQIAGSDVLYPEDLRLWASLNSSSNPWWSESFTGTLEIGAGRTSNALAGSPTDPGISGGPSGFIPLRLHSRFTPPSDKSLKPAIDLEVLGTGLIKDEYSDLSSLQAGLRLGAMVLDGERRWTFGYRAEALWLNQDSPLYSEAHRAELEVEWADGQVVFMGGGHRKYRDERRTRWEGEIGIGGPLRFTSRAPLIAGATLRLSNAQSPAYDQLGISAAASTTMPLGRRTSLRIAVSGIWENYLHSGGDEGRLVFGTEEKRRDLLGRLGLTLWAPAWHRLRPGFEVRYTRRDSTADETPGFDFSYREWRAMAWLRWTFKADPWAPRTVDKDDHMPLDWGLESGAGMDQERILDLLRGDEELRRGSSCGIP
ncbi:MAG: hypothetical protein DRJ61_01585 [Acidobacteria bacterium]|nr:MAG: hypothetical protein DRJ65_13985 [Acidobacteriota bacterium]RLE36093.1 MAG: hypothetical protein DRJ61_01585 [Acidobacteriota bacterium]